MNKKDSKNNKRKKQRRLCKIKDKMLLRNRLKAKGNIIMKKENKKF